MLLCSECDFTEKNTVEDTPKPQFKHDCEICYPLGQVDTSSADLPAGDVYVCPQGGFPTVVIRRSDEPSDYLSGDHLFEKLKVKNY